MVKVLSCSKDPTTSLIHLRKVEFHLEVPMASLKFGRKKLFEGVQTLCLGTLWGSKSLGFQLLEGSRSTEVYTPFIHMLLQVGT